MFTLSLTFTKPISLYLITSGLLASVLNYACCYAIYRRQQRLAACEVLVCANTVLAALYGHLLLYSGIANLDPIAYQRTVFATNETLWCSINSLSNTLVPMFLGLVVVISVNRYAAIKMPYEYKSVFSHRRTYFCLGGILLGGLVHYAVDLVHCRAGQLVYGHLAYHVENGLVVMKASLIVCCAATLLYVYKAISTYFQQPFWQPVTSCAVCWRRSGRDELIENDTLLSVDDPTPRTVCGNAATETLELEAVKKISGESCVDEHEEVRPSPPDQRPPGSVVCGRLAGSEQRLHRDSSLATTSIPNLAQSPSRATAHQKARYVAQHRSTVVLFFGSILFVCIAAPSCIYELSCIALTPHINPDISLMVFYLTSSLYGMLFILNPILFIQSFATRVLDNFTCCRPTQMV